MRKLEYLVKGLVVYAEESFLRLITPAASWERFKRQITTCFAVLTWLSVLAASTSKTPS